MLLQACASHRRNFLRSPFFGQPPSGRTPDLQAASVGREISWDLSSRLVAYLLYCIQTLPRSLPSVLHSNTKKSPLQTQKRHRAFLFPSREPPVTRQVLLLGRNSGKRGHGRMPTKTWLGAGIAKPPPRSSSAQSYGAQLGHCSGPLVRRDNFEWISSTACCVWCSSGGIRRQCTQSVRFIPAVPPPTIDSRTMCDSRSSNFLWPSL